MRRVLIALAFLIAASPAGAQNTKLAVIIGTQNGLGLTGVEVNYTSHLRILDQLGVQYDVFNVGATRTGAYGETGKADSTWFRERYGAVYIPFFPKNAAGANNWSTAFRNESAVTGWNKSPVGGHWSIPVYVANSATGFAVQNENPTSGDSLRMGIIAAGTRSQPTAADSLGTWRDRNLSWVRGGTSPDTVYCRPIEFAVKSAPGMAGQFTAAIAWADTVVTAVATDTMMTVWRYKPNAGKPGAVYSLLNNNGTRCISALTLCQLMLTESTVRAARRIPVAFTIHHAQSGRTPDATVDAMIDGMLDVHERAGIYSYFAMKLAPAEWGSTGAGGTTAGWERIREHLRNGWAVWYPHSHATSYDGDESDSAAFRGLYNAMLNTAVAPDSFALPRNRYDVRRFVPANDVLTKQGAATMLRAGMSTLEVVLVGQTSGADRFSHPAAAITKTFMVPGVSTVGWTKQSWDLGLLGDPLATMIGSASFGERINNSQMTQMERAIQYGNGFFQHYDALWGNTSGSPLTDRYNEWIVEHIVGGLVKKFPNVLEWDRPGTQAPIIAPIRAAR